MLKYYVCVILTVGWKFFMAQTLNFSTYIHWGRLNYDGYDVEGKSSIELVPVSSTTDVGQITDLKVFKLRLPNSDACI